MTRQKILDIIESYSETIQQHPSFIGEVAVAASNFGMMASEIDALFKPHTDESLSHLKNKKRNVPKLSEFYEFVSVEQQFVVTNIIGNQILMMPVLVDRLSDFDKKIKLPYSIHVVEFVCREDIRYIDCNKTEIDKSEYFINVLKDFSKWRKGDSDEMPNPKQVTLALDYLLDNIGIND